MGRALGRGTVSIMAMLAEGPRYGLDMTRETGMLQATVYTTLRRLEQRRLVRGQWEDAEVAEAERRPRRRYYELTPEGEVQLRVERERQAERAAAGVPVVGEADA